MDDETTRRIETVREQVFALQALLISHISAVSETDAQLVIATVENADAQIDAAKEQGMDREALALKLLLERLAGETGPLAFND